MRMPLYRFAKTSHTVKMKCSGNNISVTVLLVVLMIITRHCLGFNKTCIVMLTQVLLLYLFGKLSSRMMYFNVVFMFN